MTEEIDLRELSEEELQRILDEGENGAGYNTWQRAANLPVVRRQAEKGREGFQEMLDNEDLWKVTPGK